MTNPPGISFQIGDRPPVKFLNHNIYIGTMTSSDLRLDDSDADQIHAVVEWFPDQNSYQILDLGSRVGTMLYGQRVTRTELSIGTTFRIGGTDIMVESIAGRHQSPPLQPARDAQPDGGALPSPAILEIRLLMSAVPVFTAMGLDVAALQAIEDSNDYTRFQRDAATHARIMILAERLDRTK